MQRFMSFIKGQDAMPDRRVQHRDQRIRQDKARHTASTRAIATRRRLPTSYRYLPAVRTVGTGATRSSLPMMRSSGREGACCGVRMRTG